MTNKVERLVLFGTTYVPEKLLGGKSQVLWDEIPEVLRVSETRIRNSFGARDPKWLREHLFTFGCPVALPFGENLPGKEIWAKPSYFLYYRCPWEPTESGFCKRHKGRIHD